MTVIAFLLCTMHDFCLRRKINTICTYFGSNLRKENSFKSLQCHTLLRNFILRIRSERFIIRRITTLFANPVFFKPSFI